MIVMAPGPMVSDQLSVISRCWQLATDHWQPVGCLLAQSAASPANGGDVYLLWGFILFGVALLLLAMELFVPSGGLIGLLCGVAAIGSIVSFYRYSPLAGLIALAAYVVLTPILLVFLFKVWLHSPLARRLILGAREEPPTDSDEEAHDAAEYARQQRLIQLRQLIGAEGVTATVLRPVGVVRINGERLDALAEHGVIAENTPVVVVDVYDNQIKVRTR